MACFITPVAVAIVTTSIKKKVSSKYHLEWLNTMLWGGAVMLAVEHIAHREVIFYPPFLTAMQSPAEILVMLREMAIAGGAMTLAIVLVWVAMVFVSSKLTQLGGKKLQAVRI